MPPALIFYPPLLNSASPWATDNSDLRALLQCPETGAITTRTSLLTGFDHNPSRHRFSFFDPATARPGAGGTKSVPDDDFHPPRCAEKDKHEDSASLNSLGYSPFPLEEYISILRDLSAEFPNISKTCIFSIAGTPQDIATCFSKIIFHSEHIHFPLAMEINLSCPNILGVPPPAYDTVSLSSYVSALPNEPTIPIGIKTPPYTHIGEYSTLITALQASDAAKKLSFITSTNTLGSCLILDDALKPVLPGSIGGMAGPPIHSLSLGNVATIRKLLDQQEDLKHINIIGVGGVGDGQGYRRMRAAGASAVGLATALGKQGVGVFSKIKGDLYSAW